MFVQLSLSGLCGAVLPGQRLTENKLLVVNPHLVRYPWLAKALEIWLVLQVLQDLNVVPSCRVTSLLS